MNRATSRLLSGLLICAAGLFPSTVLHAQELVVTGRIIGPDHAPLAQQRVVLHRVDATGGATIAETLSDSAGGFVLRADAEPDTSAVLFVAARYVDGELYIGPPFRAGDADAGDQFIQVGIPELSATALMEQGQAPLMPARPPAGSRSWLLVLIPLLGVAGVVVYALVPRGKIPPERALLIRVAELDERVTTAPDAQRLSLLAERQRLMAELRGD
jgi:hypothetical protein